MVHFLASHVGLPEGSFWFLWTCRVSSLHEFRSYFRFIDRDASYPRISLDYQDYLGLGYPSNLHFLRVLMGGGGFVGRSWHLEDDF